jgi:hypothetical protein
MKTFENINVGDEIEFINSKNKKQLAIVNFVNEKKFTILVSYYSKQNGVNDLKLSFYKSGKKTSRFYNYGNATRVANKWSDFIKN